MSQLVKDLDLKAFHNDMEFRGMLVEMSQLVKDLDLKAFHNTFSAQLHGTGDVTARQRS